MIPVSKLAHIARNASLAPTEPIITCGELSAIADLRSDALRVASATNQILKAYNVLVNRHGILRDALEQFNREGF